MEDAEVEAEAILQCENECPKSNSNNNKKWFPLGKESDRGRSRHVRAILFFITTFGTIWLFRTWIANYNVKLQFCRWRSAAAISRAEETLHIITQCWMLSGEPSEPPWSLRGWQDKEKGATPRSEDSTHHEPGNHFLDAVGHLWRSHGRWKIGWCPEVGLAVRKRESSATEQWLID